MICKITNIFIFWIKPTQITYQIKLTNILPIPPSRLRREYICRVESDGWKTWDVTKEKMGVVKLLRHCPPNLPNQTEASLLRQPNQTTQTSLSMFHHQLLKPPLTPFSQSILLYIQSYLNTNISQLSWIYTIINKYVSYDNYYWITFICRW